jgi:hypothetical protein
MALSKQLPSSFRHRRHGWKLFVQIIKELWAEDVSKAKDRILCTVDLVVAQIYRGHVSVHVGTLKVKLMLLLSVSLGVFRLGNDGTMIASASELHGVSGLAEPFKNFQMQYCQLLVAR